MYEINENPRKIYKSFGTKVLTDDVASEKILKVSDFPIENVTSWRFKRYFFKPPINVNNRTLPMMDTTLRAMKPQDWGKAIINTTLAKDRIDCNKFNFTHF